MEYSVIEEIEIDDEMLRQMYFAWSRTIDSILDFTVNESVTIVGNNRVWSANLESMERVNWIKEGF